MDISRTDFQSTSLLKQIVARSYAYLGYILIRRRKLVESRVENLPIVQKDIFKLYLNGPSEAARKAYSMCSNDTVVLTRYGRALWNKAFETKQKKKNEKFGRS